MYVSSRSQQNNIILAIKFCSTETRQHNIGQLRWLRCEAVHLNKNTELNSLTIIISEIYDYCYYNSKWCNVCLLVVKNSRDCLGIWYHRWPGNHGEFLRTLSNGVVRFC